MFITQNELETLTGYVKRASQREWLDKHQWIYESAANGRVVVSRAYAEAKLSGIQQKKEWTPNFDALRKVA